MCKGVVYFHKAKTQDIERLYSGRNGYTTLVGSDRLTTGNLKDIIPYCNRASANFLRPQQTQALKRAHSWLVQPNHAAEQQRPTQLSAGQAAYAKPESGFRRIRGAAGAGKSYVLSHRAAASNAQGRNVLVLCFNITMSHTLKDLLMRTPSQLDWDRITWGHFHRWAKNQIVEAGLITTGSSGPDTENDYDRPGDNINEFFVEALEKILSGTDLAQSYRMPRYGGIYIDEGQDFDPRWLDALAGFLSEDGELVVFADHKQNIYSQKGARDVQRTLKRCKFRGKWAQLPQKSYRLPWRITMFLNDFAAAMQLGDEDDLEMQDYAERARQGELALDILGWKNIDSVAECLQFLPDAFQMLGEPNPGDVVVLVPTHEIGCEAVNLLSDTYLQIVHIFGEGGAKSYDTRRRKMAFWMGRGGLKMCTVASFKGWELDNVILIWPPEDDYLFNGGTKRTSIFYTALSRATRNLIVLNADRTYDRFASNWDDIPATDQVPQPHPVP
jgi:hypothetical protein